MSAFHSRVSTLLLFGSVAIIGADDWEIVTQDQIHSVSITMPQGCGYDDLPGEFLGKLGRLDDPPRCLLDFFDKRSKTVKPDISQMSDVEMEEVRSTGINGDSNWKLLAYWAGTTRTSFGTTGAPAILLRYIDSLTGNIEWFQARWEPRGETYWRFHHLQLQDVLKHLNLLVDAPTLGKMHEENESSKLRTAALEKEVIELQNVIAEQKRDYEQLNDELTQSGQQRLEVTNKLSGEVSKFESEVSDAKAAIELLQEENQKLVHSERHLQDTLHQKGQAEEGMQRQINAQNVAMKALNVEKNDLQNVLRRIGQEHTRQLTDLRSENDKQRIIMEQFQHQGQVIGIVCVSTGGLAFVFGVVFLALRCKWREDVTTFEDEQHISNDESIYAGDVVIPGKLENNRPPILVDECEKFGLNEIYDVTAGEGGDLVRIARPLETAGATRKLSEELLNIQSIYQGQEGRESSELHGTSPGDTNGGDVVDDDQSGNWAVNEMGK